MAFRTYGIDGLGAHSEGSSRTDLLGRLGELGGGDHLHCLGDLLDVSDGLESDTKLLQLTRGVSGLNYDLSTSLHSTTHHYCYFQKPKSQATTEK